jgi:hypothetical protein
VVARWGYRQGSADIRGELALVQELLIGSHLAYDQLGTVAFTIMGLFLAKLGLRRSDHKHCLGFWGVR